MWTEERVADLRKYWAEGLSASQVAKQLGGVTRNAVIGKLRRIHAPLRQRKAPAQPNKGKTARIVERKIGAPIAVAAPASIDAAGLAPLATFSTLKSNACHYPSGDPKHDDFGYCGRSAIYRGYCQHHAALCYRKESPAQKRARKALARYLASGERASAP